MQNAVCVAVMPEPWLLDFREFLEEALEFSRGSDNLEGGKGVCPGKGCLNGAVNLVVNETDQSLPLEIHAEVVCVEKVGAEEGLSNVGQDELVNEGDAMEDEVSGGCAVRPDPGPVGGAEGAQALGGELV